MFVRFIHHIIHQSSAVAPGCPAGAGAPASAGRMRCGGKACLVEAFAATTWWHSSAMMRPYPVVSSAMSSRWVLTEGSVSVELRLVANQVPAEAAIRVPSEANFLQPLKVLV